MGFFDKIKSAAKSTVSTVGSFIPGIGDAAAQKEANQTNIQLDSMNRNWQERMSNSAYQRAMDDMKKAGLNPMLAYMQGGASVPSTSAPSVGSESRTALADKALASFSGISSARTAQQNAQTQQASAEASVRLADVQTAKTVAETQQVQAETKLKQRELRGKGVKDTLDREGGKIIQNIMDKLTTSAKENHSPLIRKVGGDKPHDSKMFNWLSNKKPNHN